MWSALAAPFAPLFHAPWNLPTGIFLASGLDRKDHREARQFDKEHVVHPKMKYAWLSELFWLFVEIKEFFNGTMQCYC